MSPTTHQQTSSFTKEKHPISSHTICPLISGNCDREIIANCGEQNLKRFPGFPAELCPHALSALINHAKSLSLNNNDVSTSGRGNTATLRLKGGEQLAVVTRGTLTTSTRHVN